MNHGFAQRGRLVGIKNDGKIAGHPTASVSITGDSRRHPGLTVPRRRRHGPVTKIGSIEVVLTGNSDQRKEGVAASLREPFGGFVSIAEAGHVGHKINAAAPSLWTVDQLSAMGADQGSNSGISSPRAAASKRSS